MMEGNDGHQEEELNKDTPQPGSSLDQTDILTDLEAKGTGTGPETPSEATGTDKKAEAKKVEEDVVFPITIFAIKTAIGHEKMVVNSIANRARKRHAEIFAILSPTKLRGYILVEGRKNVNSIQNLIKGLEHVKNIIEGDTALGEIEHFLTPKPLVSGIAIGDIVEIVNGPFKGEKARVRQIDESKEEITVELFEAMVSIPVTIRGDHVRVLEKEAE